MRTKILKKIIFLSVLLSLVFGIAWVFAANTEDADKGGLEITYPILSEHSDVKPPKGVTTFLPRYIKYIYHFFVITGGLVALMSLIYGGFRFMTSVGNPAAITDARNQIFAGFLGLVVILGSYVILNELNPDLTSLKVPQIQSLRKGIILYSIKDCGGSEVSEPSLPELSDIDESKVKYKALQASGNAIIGKHPEIIYARSLYTFHSSDELKLELFQNEECLGSPAQTINDVTAEEVKIGGVCRPIDAKEIQCIKFVWNIPGIWVFNELNEAGDRPNPNHLPMGWKEGREYMIFQYSQSQLPSLFHDKIKAIAIVPDKKLNMNYGVVLHNMPGGFMKNKGWARIYLPGESSYDNHECEVQEGITLCGPFNTPYKGALHGNMDDASSLTIFDVPDKDTNVPPYSVQVCRQDRCEPQRVEGVVHDVYKWLTPGEEELKDITSTFGEALLPYFGGNNTLYGHSFKGDTWWEEGEKIVKRRNAPDGISAVTIEEGARYLVLLFAEHFDDFKKINSPESFVEATILSQSSPSLRTLQWDGKTGTIVVINTRTGNF